MLEKMFWKMTKYRKFKREWKEVLDAPRPELSLEFIKELCYLTSHLSINEIDEYYNAECIISICYFNVEDWLVKCNDFKLRVTGKSLSPQPTLYPKPVKYEDFFTTKEGRAVSYGSGVVAIRNALLEFVAVMETNDKAYSDYVLKQLRECFIAGMIVCLTLVKEYAGE